MNNTTKQSTFRCPQCGSSHTVKDGLDRQSKKQRYQCKLCGKNFLETSKSEKKRILVMSDLHCGHKYGITPPSYQINKDQDPNCHEYQRESYNWFENTINLWKPFDICIVNGDLIDGKGKKNGSNECLTTDRMQQADMAYKVIHKTKAKRYFVVKGTPYHAGDQENFEQVVSDRLGGTFVNKLYLDVNGCRIKCRHKIGSSSVPHGRATPLLRSMIWDELNVDTKQDRANILIYSHVHYHIYAGYGNNRLALTTPALQGRTEYGETQCEGIVHYGMVIIDIDKNGLFKHTVLKASLESLKQDILY